MKKLMDYVSNKVLEKTGISLKKKLKYWNNLKKNTNNFWWDIKGEIN